MGGRLAVDSRPGEGTRFTLTLPAAAASADTVDPLERLSA
jgi:signal transduction histidine kinase